jgi:hypothetical protein
MKKFMILILALVFVSAFAAGQGKTKSEVEAMLTNFSISLTLNARGQDAYNFRQATSDRATFFETKSRSHEIMYFDFVRKIGYELDADEKYGESFPLEPVEEYKGFGPYMVNHLFIHQNYKNDMVRTGSERILGRNTTVYTVRFPNAEMKLWIDDQYGFTLKYEQTGNNPITMNVTQFTAGGVNVESLIRLSDYEID